LIFLTNLDEVSSIPQVVCNVLHQTISFIWLQNIPPEQSWLAEIVFITRVVPAG
jgi:hypothetical protein